MTPIDTATISVWLVEDSRSFRNQLSELLSQSDGMECGRAFGDVESAISEVSSGGVPPPTVLLMDYELPGQNGVDGIRALKELLPDVPMVMLTNYYDEDLIYNALTAGASGYLIKDASLDRVADAIREAANGGMLIPPKVASRVLTFFRRDTFDQPVLTPKETEVVSLLADGLSQKEIAAELGRSKFTVNVHLRSVYQKLHVNSGIQAVVKAMDSGLIRRISKRRRSGDDSEAA